MSSESEAGLKAGTCVDQLVARTAGPGEFCATQSLFLPEIIVSLSPSEGKQQVRGEVGSLGKAI